MAEPLLFPLFLKLAGRKVLLVGAGPVGAAKLASLRGTGARVTVVAPAICADVEAEEGVRLERRGFRPEDVEGAWLAIAAAPPEVNRAVAAAAEPRCLFVNAVDDPPRASAYASGVVRRAGVTLAISTAGLAPALAGLLREGLEALLPDDLDAWVEQARALREGQKAAGVPLHERRPLLLRALEKLYAKDRG